MNKQDVKKICEKEGHDFGPWKEFNEEVWIDHQFVTPGRVNGWYRTCKRCEESEWSNEKPKEVTEEDSKKA